MLLRIAGAQDQGPAAYMSATPMRTWLAAWGMACITPAGALKAAEAEKSDSIMIQTASSGT